MHRRHGRRDQQRTRRQLGEFIGMSPSRPPGWTRLLLQVERTVRESGDVRGFDPERWLTEFLRAPSRALGARAPHVLMRTAAGRGRIAQLIAQMQSGAYA